MKYLILVLLLLLVSCSLGRKINNILNKNIYDSFSVKIDTIKEYKNISSLNKQNTLKKNSLYE